MSRDRNQLLVTFGYDGSRFHGIAPQPDHATAGSALKQRFLAAGVYPKALNFSSRTDAGVHALRNIATCWLRGPVDVERVMAQVSAPNDDGLRNVQVFRVPVHVHARALSRGKHYRYLVDDGWENVPSAGTESWYVAPILEPGAMRDGAGYLLGEHDFTSFCARRSKGVQDPRREITGIEITCASGPGPGKRVIFDIRGRSFLRHMVRIIIGTLAEVGAGVRRPEEVAAALTARCRGAAGPTAPGHGLTLVEVYSEWPLPPAEVPPYG